MYQDKAEETGDMWERSHSPNKIGIGNNIPVVSRSSQKEGDRDDGDRTQQLLVRPGNISIQEEEIQEEDGDDDGDDGSEGEDSDDEMDYRRKFSVVCLVGLILVSSLGTICRSTEATLAFVYHQSSTPHSAVPPPQHKEGPTKGEKQKKKRQCGRGGRYKLRDQNEFKKYLEEMEGGPLF